MQRDAKLPTELVNAFSTFRNSPAPFSIQCGREQNGTENRKHKKGEKKSQNKTNREQRMQERRRSSSWKRLNYILGIAALSVFQFVIVCLRRHRKILNGNFAIWFMKGVRGVADGAVRERERETAVFALQVPAKFQRKWIRLWHSILYFGYPPLWQTQSAAMICQRKVFVTVLCGAWVGISDIVLGGEKIH